MHNEHPRLFEALIVMLYVSGSFRYKIITVMCDISEQICLSLSYIMKHRNCASDEEREGYPHHNGMDKFSAIQSPTPPPLSFLSRELLYASIYTDSTCHATALLNGK